MERGDWSGAESLFQQAVTVCPVDADARRNYAETLWRRGAHQDAVTQLNEAIRLSGDDTTLLVRMAEMQLAWTQAEAAANYCQQALDLNPNDASAWRVRGRILRGAGQPRESLAAFQRALTMEPENRELLLESAELYRQLDQPRRALSNLYSLLDTYPSGEEPPHALYLCGLSYLELERYDDATASLSLAVNRGRPTPDMLCRLAEAHLAAGRLNEAHQAALDALAMQPNHAESRTLLARLADAGNHQRR